MEEICGLVHLTELVICGVNDLAVGLPHNIFALTKLKILNLELRNIETFPDEMVYSFIQLQKLYLNSLNVEYLPRSFTCYGGFPTLTNLNIICCMNLIEFPEVDEGALLKLEIIHFTERLHLKTLPLSLEKLSSLRKLILDICEQSLRDSCRKNCEKSSI